MFIISMAIAVVKALKLVSDLMLGLQLTDPYMTANFFCLLTLAVANAHVHKRTTALGWLGSGGYYSFWIRT